MRREVDERDRPFRHRQPHASGQELLRWLIERNDALERHVGEHRRREDLRDRADLEQGPLCRRTATCRCFAEEADLGPLALAHAPAVFLAARLTMPLA
jgi:hypothetical protein